MKKLLTLVSLLFVLVMAVSAIAIAEEAAPCEHDYAQKIQAAACNKRGSITYTCTLCGDSYKETLPALVHEYGNWIPYEGDFHISDCKVKGCEHIGRNKCKYGTAKIGETEIKVCIVCGKFGDKQWKYLSRNNKYITPAKGTYVPAGEWFVRGASNPVPGVTYAFTLAIEEAGKARTFNGPINVSVKASGKGIADCKLYLAEGENLTEIPFTYESSYVTFDTEVSGLYLLMPAAQ